jgi:hypothetical protein
MSTMSARSVRYLQPTPRPSLLNKSCFYSQSRNEKK